MNRIEFYKVSEPYGEFSNFAPFPIEIDGQRWPTTEHYFQAQKFLDAGRAEAIRTTAFPMIAARTGRSRKYPIRSDWEQVKEGIMQTALLAKFSQHPALRTLLLETGDAEIIEHTRNDAYWADGGDGSGQNKLGQLLMNVRKVLGSASRAAIGLGMEDR